MVGPRTPGYATGPGPALGPWKLRVSRSSLVQSEPYLVPFPSEFDDQNFRKIICVHGQIGDNKTNFTLPSWPVTFADNYSRYFRF